MKFVISKSVVYFVEYKDPHFDGVIRNVTFISRENAFEIAEKFDGKIERVEVTRKIACIRKGKK